jgi:hypothetical protein
VKLPWPAPFDPRRFNFSVGQPRLHRVAAHDHVGEQSLHFVALSRPGEPKVCKARSLTFYSFGQVRDPAPQVGGCNIGDVGTVELYDHEFSNSR